MWCKLVTLSDPSELFVVLMISVLRNERSDVF